MRKKARKTEHISQIELNIMFLLVLVSLCEAFVNNADTNKKQAIWIIITMNDF